MPRKTWIATPGSDRDAGWHHATPGSDRDAFCVPGEGGVGQHGSEAGAIVILKFS